MKQYKQEIVDAILARSHSDRIIPLRSCTAASHIPTSDCFDIMRAVLKALPDYKAVRMVDFPHSNASLFQTLTFVDRSLTL